MWAFEQHITNARVPHLKERSGAGIPASLRYLKGKTGQAGRRGADFVLRNGHAELH